MDVSLKHYSLAEKGKQRQCADQDQVCCWGTGRVPNTKGDSADSDGCGAGSGLMSRDLSPSTAASPNPHPSLSATRVQNLGHATQFTMLSGKLIPSCSDAILNCGQSHDKTRTKSMRSMEGKDATNFPCVCDFKWLESLHLELKC